MKQNSIQNIVYMKDEKKPQQLELFASFLSDDTSLLSNALIFWDLIPKYFITPQKQLKLPKQNGRAIPVTWDFAMMGNKYSITINPAQIKVKATNGVDDRYKDFFPGPVEELIESALIKMLTKDKECYIEDADTGAVYVQFTYQGLKKELKALGHTYSIPRIKIGLAVLQESNIKILKNGKQIYSTGIFPALAAYDRSVYLDNSSTKHLAQLSEFVVKAIKTGEYRQIDYDKYMKYKSQLTRWLYKKLVIRYTQASPIDEYSFSLKSLMSECALLQYKEYRMNKSRLIETLEQLKNSNVILSWEVINTKKDGRKVVDDIFQVFANPKFASEQKKASKRISMITSQIK